MIKLVVNEQLEAFHILFRVNQSPCVLGVHPGTFSSKLQAFLKQVSLAEPLVEALTCSN